MAKNEIPALESRRVRIHPFTVWVVPTEYCLPASTSTTDACVIEILSPACSCSAICNTRGLAWAQLAHHGRLSRSSYPRGFDKQSKMSDPCGDFPCILHGS